MSIPIVSELGIRSGRREVIYRIGDWEVLLDEHDNCVRLNALGASEGESAERPVVAALTLREDDLKLMLAMARVRSSE